MLTDFQIEYRSEPHLDLTAEDTSDYSTPLFTFEDDPDFTYDLFRDFHDTDDSSDYQAQCIKEIFKL